MFFSLRTFEKLKAVNKLNEQSFVSIILNDATWMDLFKNYYCARLVAYLFYFIAAIDRITNVGR